MSQVSTAPVTQATWSKDAIALVDVLATTTTVGSLTHFAAAVKAAGLLDEYAERGPFTVFAPTDEAIKKLPAGAYEALLQDPSKLKAVLKYHIISGHFMSKDIWPGDVMTLQGSTLSVSGPSSEIRINNARITQANIAAANGVVHAIDTVILPKHWQLLAPAA